MQLRSGRTLGMRQEVVEENTSITNKRLKKQLETTAPQVGVRVDVDEKKKLELNDLPVEILTDIISRLPITSVLGAVKYTCKLWEWLVSDPMFLESYTTETPGFLYALKGDSNLYFAVKSTDDKPVGIKLPGDLGNKAKFKCVCSCRGLLCYRDMEDKSICLCNPIIGDVVKIPTWHYGRRAESTWKLGYAPLSKKYKLFQVSIEKRRNKKTFRYAAAIFTVGGELWRDVDLPQNLTNGRQSNIFAEYCNGAFYWRMPDWWKTTDVPVMSFDLDTETFRVRHFLPNGTNRNFPWFTKYLTVLGETIAYVICCDRRLQQVWILVDEVEDIWVEKYRFFVPTPGVDDIHFTLVGLWLNKEMYGMEYTKTREMGPGCADGITGKRFLWYKANSKMYSVLQLPFPKDINADSILPELVISHVGSFLSPSKIVAAGR